MKQRKSKTYSIFHVSNRGILSLQPRKALGTDPVPPPNSQAPFKVTYALENKVVRADSFPKLPHLLPQNCIQAYNWNSIIVYCANKLQMAWNSCLYTRTEFFNVWVCFLPSGVATVTSGNDLTFVNLSY